MDGAVETQNETIDQIIEEVTPTQDQAIEQIENEEITHDKTMVPLSALQKVREKKRELELELQWERQRNAQTQSANKHVEEDNSRFESATREDLSNAQGEAIRIIEERLWVKQNPEKFEKVNEFLPQFLKQRPNLVTAISQASNRYEEAYILMEALTPKQQQQLKAVSSQKKEAPNAPTSVPKAASLNQAVDVMNMSDSEFSTWRQSQKKRR